MASGESTGGREVSHRQIVLGPPTLTSRGWPLTVSLADKTTMIGSTGTEKPQAAESSFAARFASARDFLK